MRQVVAQRGRAATSLTLSATVVDRISLSSLLSLRSLPLCSFLCIPSSLSSVSYLFYILYSGGVILPFVLIPLASLLLFSPPVAALPSLNISPLFASSVSLLSRPLSTSSAHAYWATSTALPGKGLAVEDDSNHELGSDGPAPSRLQRSC